MAGAQLVTFTLRISSLVSVPELPGPPLLLEGMVPSSELALTSSALALTSSELVLTPDLLSVGPHLLCLRQSELLQSGC